MKQIDIKSIGNVRIGHAQNMEAGTGCTVILAPSGAISGVDVRGGAPATRETDLLNSVNLIDSIFAVTLSGGSAYGLDASGGVMKFLEEKKIGFDVGVGVVPIVCGASLFDLIVGNPDIRPDSKMGYEACVNAYRDDCLEEGNVGAGTGATVGKIMGAERMMKSGIGYYALQVGDLKVGAIVAVNALGDVVDKDTSTMLAGVLKENKSEMDSTARIVLENYDSERNVFSGNTTIGCVLTNAKLTKVQANKLASIAHNGYADVIRPVHTMSDGDSIFTMSFGEVSADILAIGILAQEVTSRAVNRAVLAARPAFGLMCANDFRV
ncbi:MAG: peptidase S58 family protein [Clostridia bacterium]|nr:peptidase S58 family protein [Clostridia bacterium]